MKTTLIRDARPDDEADLQHLTWLLWDHHHSQKPGRFRPADEIAAAKQPAAPSYQLAERTWVAEASGRPVGYLKAVLRDAPQSLAYQPQRIVIILEVAVLPAFRRLGSGRALVAEAQNWARESAADAIEVPAFGFNEGAISLYSKMGFRTWFVQLRHEINQ